MKSELLVFFPGLLSSSQLEVYEIFNNNISNVFKQIVHIFYDCLTHLMKCILSHNNFPLLKEVVIYQYRSMNVWISKGADYISIINGIHPLLSCYYREFGAIWEPIQIVFHHLANIEKDQLEEGYQREYNRAFLCPN